ncbi:MAG: VWA domain-containing protein [Sandaracinaceae bacterium]
MKKFLGLAALVALAGCSSDTAGRAAIDPETMGPTGSRTVTQGGAQDIGYFRSIVAAGDVPRPNTIEPVGFFAEHAVDLPPADCGDTVCLHANLAVAPGIDRESNWTMAFVAMNTPVDPRELERPETHVVLAIEDTTRTALVSENVTRLFRALTAELLAGDRVSVVRIGQNAQVLAEGLAPSDPALATAIGGLNGLDAQAALYDGLARAAQLTQGLEGFGGAHRVVLLTSGLADAGITDDMRIVGLGEALAREGTGVSVVGVGEGYRPELAAQISEGGGGSYYYAQDGDDLEEIFRLEGRTSLFPLATGFELVVTPSPGYRVGRIYGARRAWAEEAGAHLSSPVLMVGNRTGADDVEEGRRGGGGGLFVELIADADSGMGSGAPAFIVSGTWTDAQTGEAVEQSITVANGLAPGENPGGMFPHFADPLRGKAFMMLNMYLALRATSELYHGGSCPQALGIEPALLGTYEGWQAEYDDPDIDADWFLLTALNDNVQSRCGAVEPAPPNVPMSCFHD